MLEAARTGAAASTDDTAQLISQLDAIELAIVSAQAEQQQCQQAMAAALAQAKQANHGVELIALEASEVAVQVFTEQYLPLLAEHMASHWRVHREYWRGQNVQQLAADAAQQLIEAAAQVEADQAMQHRRLHRAA